jgi:hypothetical protein
VVQNLKLVIAAGTFNAGTVKQMPDTWLVPCLTLYQGSIGVRMKSFCSQMHHTLV